MLPCDNKYVIFNNNSIIIICIIFINNNYIIIFIILDYTCRYPLMSYINTYVQKRMQNEIHFDLRSVSI